ncbi:MAG: glycosyltransferase [Ruminococcaceae bacterium]|nr:glycosyltransferase [Oscillospiraceae bacterium]
MEHLVSVIIPCYNAERYLDMSIGSVFEQDYNSIELIIVNDGSTDRSEEIIFSWKKRFEEKGLSLVYVHQENKGLGGAINTGLKYVSGEYITLLDADDQFLQGSIRKRAEYLASHPECSGVRSNGWYVKGERRWLFITEEKEKNISDLFTALSLGQTNNWAGTYMLRTDVFFTVYPDRNIFPSRLGQNLQLLLPVSYKRKVGYIDEPLTEYFIYDNSHSHASDLHERKVVEERNSEGYREIYFKILNMLTTDTNELELYGNMYNSTFYRREMRRMLGYKDVKKAKHYYKLLKTTQYCTISDSIDIYSVTCKPLAIILKVVRKMKNLIKL